MSTMGSVIHVIILSVLLVLDHQITAKFLANQSVNNVIHLANVYPVNWDFFWMELLVLNVIIHSVQLVKIMHRIVL